MEKLVYFRDRQEVTSDDLSNIGAFGRTSIDHVVHDGIQDGNGWADFTVTETGVAEITVSEGRLYFAGAAYTAEDENIFDLITSLPTTNYKWMAVVGYGNSIDTDTQARDFLIDATTGATEPAAVAMQKLRKAEIGTIVGTEAPQPVKPTIGSGNIVIAWVYLNPTGVQSISLAEENRLPQAARNAADIDDLEAWRDAVGPQIDALRSLIASLQAQIDNVANNETDIDPLYIDMARVKEQLEIEDSYTDYDADRFLDTAESDTDHVNYYAAVEEGVRFPNAGSNQAAIQLYNPLNPDVAVGSNNMLLPKYTEEVRLKVYPYSSELSISQYSYQTNAMKKRTVARTRIRYGESKTVCTNNAWWRSGRYDPVQQIFYKDGDTWQVLPDSRGKWKRLRRFWYDTYDEHYWERITVTHQIDGQQIAQTLLNATDGWLTSIGLYFTQAGGTGNVDVAIARVTESGLPDLQNLLGSVTLAVEDILTSSDGTIETKVSFPPTFLEGGKRYAIVLTTGGNHYVAMAQGTQYAQGTFFYNVDGAYQMGTFDKDMMFSLYFAKFTQIRTVVALNTLSLSNGITDIDILASMVVPESCSLVFEIQPEGSTTWYPLDSVISGNTVLYNKPASALFRAVFTGTTDVQPGIDLTDSDISYSRPATVFKHLSEVYTLASSTQTFKVVAILENYYETNHDLAATILIDGTGGEVAAGSVTDVELDPPADARSANHKRIKRTWSWTSTQITSAMSSVAIVMNGSTSSELDTFHVGERIHLAF